MMSKENALEICSLRKEGYGPTAIARHLGLPVSTVKSYIYRHFTMRDARCQYCGKIIRVPKHEAEEHPVRLLPGAFLLGLNYTIPSGKDGADYACILAGNDLRSLSGRVMNTVPPF